MLNESSLTQHDKAARAGAAKIVVHCLGLVEGESLCLFSDETTDVIAEIITQAAVEIGVRVTPFRVSVETQREYAVSNNLPRNFDRALQNSRGVLTCLAADTRSTGFRRELLRLGVNEGTRFGHMPGASLYSLATAANIDYVEAVERCEQLAYALDLGVEAELKTWRLDASERPGEEHILTMSLGGAKRNPITSTGVISSNTWGNIPGGETFIAPIEDTGSGTFVLNGSLNGRICAPNECVVLEFKKGRAKVLRDTSDSLALYLWGMIQPALDSGDQFADSLAELGIGVNLGITALTGSALIDEKCAGTAHIALGDNQRYGGLHSSNVHEDLITRRPTLTINGKLIIEEGEYRFNATDWFTSLREVHLRPDFSSPSTRVRRKSGVNAETSAGLRVVRLVSAGRRGRYRISTEPDSHVLSALWETLPFSPGSISLGQVREKLNQSFAPLAFQGLQHLFDHDLISVITQR